MSISISNSLSMPLTSTSPSTKATSEPAHPSSVSEVTVKLSQAGQVHMMKQQGMSLSQIASNLSITVATVDGYLGIQVPKAVSTPSQPSPQIPTSASIAPVVTTAPAKG